MDRPVLRYFGGKWKLSPWIVSFFPEHDVYVEPFGGGASVLMRKDRSRSEVYNDLDDEVVNVFRVYQDRATARELLRKLKSTPYARQEMTLALGESQYPVERARRTIIKAFMGFASAPGHKHPGFRRAVTGANTTAAADWKNYLRAARAFTERLQGVLIENTDALELIEKYDSPETLFYLDPPYTSDTRRTGATEYKHEMPDHAPLIDAIRSAKGKVLLSGYDNPLYASLNWRRESVQHYAQANNAEMRSRTESLWLNPAAEIAQPQRSLFGSNA